MFCFVFFLSGVCWEWNEADAQKVQWPMNTNAAPCSTFQLHKVICRWQFIVFPQSGLKIISTTAEVHDLPLFYHICTDPCTKTNSLNECVVVSLSVIVTLKTMNATNLTQPSSELQNSLLVFILNICKIYRIPNFFCSSSLSCFLLWGGFGTF